MIRTTVRRLARLARRTPPTATGLGVGTALLLAVATISSCSTRPATSTLPPPGNVAPLMVDAGARLQCVTYARDLSGIQIRGDAWTWWNQAAGRYHRGTRPAPGAVLVYKRKGSSRGHLAVVTRVIDDRTVVASHANWLNGGQVHENTPIRDVSSKGDWSAVRTWYIPGQTWGRSAYATHGFIYPGPLRTAERQD